jgi:uncharacterized OB-fold protein
MSYARPSPLVDAHSKPFWDGLKEGRLVLPKCRSCGHLQVPFGPCCSSCLATEFDWPQMSGRGEIWSFIVYHHVYHRAFADKIPYNVAEVRLEEGPKFLSNIVDIPNEELRSGMRVTAVFDKVEDGTVLLRFRPDASA